MLLTLKVQKLQQFGGSKSGVNIRNSDWQNAFGNIHIIVKLERWIMDMFNIIDRMISLLILDLEMI